jgi:hypothetical protein
MKNPPSGSLEIFEEYQKPQKHHIIVEIMREEFLPDSTLSRHDLPANTPKNGTQCGGRCLARIPQRRRPNDT